jgi:hypothetical protein
MRTEKIFAAGTVALCTLLLAAPSSRAAAVNCTYGVGALAEVSVSGSGMQWDQVQNIGNGFDCDRSNTALASDSNSTQTFSTSAFASSGSSIGHLALSTYASSLANDPNVIKADSAASGIFMDRLTVTSGTYAPGTNVAFTFSLELAYSFLAGGGPFASGFVGADLILRDATTGAQLLDLTLQAYSGQDVGNGLPPATTTISLIVGNTYVIQGDLTGRTDASSGSGAFGIESDLTLIANHSASYGIQSDDPNASYLTDSGCVLDGLACEGGDPVTAVGEPSTAALLPLSIAGVTFLGRRRRIPLVRT